MSRARFPRRTYGDDFDIDLLILPLKEFVKIHRNKDTLTAEEFKLAIENVKNQLHSVPNLITRILDKRVLGLIFNNPVVLNNLATQLKIEIPYDSIMPRGDEKIIGLHYLLELYPAKDVLKLFPPEAKVDLHCQNQETGNTTVMHLCDTLRTSSDCNSIVAGNINFLIENKADTNIRNKKGWSCLIFVMWKGLQAQNLIEKICDLHVIAPNEPHPILSAADSARWSDDAMFAVECLLKSRLSESIKNYPQAITLLVKLKNAHQLLQQNMQLFLPHINTTNEAGETPLITAVKRRDLETVQLLYKNKADIQAVDKGKRNALHWALLSIRDFDYSGPDYVESFADDKITNSLKQEIVKILLDLGSQEFRVLSNDSDRLALAQKLLHAKDDEGNTPLHLRVDIRNFSPNEPYNYQSHPDIAFLKWILSKVCTTLKIDINLTNHKNQTPVIKLLFDLLYCKYERFNFTLANKEANFKKRNLIANEILKILIKNKADIYNQILVALPGPFQQAASKGHTPLEIAKIFSFPEMASILEEEMTRNTKLANQALACIAIYKKSEPKDKADELKDALPKNQLQETYQAIQAIDNPQSLSPELNKAMGELMLDVIHNSKPGMTFNKDYLFILAQDNYNYFLLKAYNFILKAEDQRAQQENESFSQPIEQKTESLSNAPKIVSLDQKDTPPPVHEIKIPEHDLLRTHLSMTQYYDDSKDYQEALIKFGDDLDKIAENIEKRKVLADIFAKDAAWKELTQYIQKQIKNSKTDDPFLYSLIVQKLRCEIELDNKKRAEHIAALHESIKKEMGGVSGLGLWDKSINFDLKKISDALPATDQIKVKAAPKQSTRIRDRS